MIELIEKGDQSKVNGLIDTIVNVVNPNCGSNGCGCGRPAYNDDVYHVSYWDYYSS